MKVEYLLFATSSFFVVFWLPQSPSLHECSEHCCTSGATFFPRQEFAWLFRHKKNNYKNKNNNNNKILARKKSAMTTYFSNFVSITLSNSHAFLLHAFLFTEKQWRDTKRRIRKSAVSARSQNSNRIIFTRAVKTSRVEQSA